jgi:hypothetical protein
MARGGGVAVFPMTEVRGAEHLKNGLLEKEETLRLYGTPHGSSG